MTIANIEQHCIKIGDIEIEGKAFLAPMAGITDGPFRMIAENFGAPMVVSEMIASAALASGMDEMKRKLKPSGKLPHIVQLAGNEARWLILGAKMAADTGADIIDINLGCPSKKVTNGYAGSALMRVPEKALALIEAVVGAVDLPVTVKMRLGWNDEQINAPHIANLAQSAGVQMIVVHGRTRQQFYKGQARWKPVRDVVEAVNIPVVVNGDIVDFNSAKNALADSNAAAVMIGRGAQGQPWIVGQIDAALHSKPVANSPVGAELLDIIISHYNAMRSAYGDDLAIRVARKHLRWYLQRAGVSQDIIRQHNLLTLNDCDEVISALKEIIPSHFQASSAA
ncbi:MAG: tRNA dihydrouridine synthase DusB [Devosiaceae bacterium]|nr:tRNA dihydrouridine synthase DusB [Devosiaceae bacterium]